MYLKNSKWIFWKLILCVPFLLLQACASSDVSREASSSFNQGYHNFMSMFQSNGGDDLYESYANTSQRSKGEIIGGTTGAVAGGLTTGVGVIPGAAGGAIFGGALGAYIDAHSSLLDKLNNRGVKVIVLGDQVLIVLPSRHIFTGMSGEINATEYSTLNLVSALISGFPNISVRIAAYTNASGPAAVNRAIAKQQADSILKYLWRTGINTRLLYADGEGGTKLVAPNSENWEESENYRVEITLEKLPV